MILALLSYSVDKADFLAHDRQQVAGVKPSPALLGHFPTVVVALIGKLQQTLADRSIEIRMERKLPPRR